MRPIELILRAPPISFNRGSSGKHSRGCSMSVFSSYDGTGKIFAGNADEIDVPWQLLG